MDVDAQQEQRIIIKFLVVEGVSGAEIHCCLLAVFKSETLSRSRVFERCARFRSRHNQSAVMTMLAHRVSGNGSQHGFRVLGLPGRYCCQL